MANQIKKIFIASRFEEFKEIRERLRNELSYYGMDFIDLNDNKAVAHPPLERSLQNVRESDTVILLVGDTYGNPLPGKSKSYTHLEYEEAKKYKKNIYVFCIGKSDTNNVIRSTTIQKMKEWRKELDKNHTLSFHYKSTNIEDIAHEIIKSVYIEENKVWLDDDTGFMWQVQIPDIRYAFVDQLKYRNQLNQNSYGGFNDWRIPSIDELKTINTEESYKNSYGYDEETFIKKPLVYSMIMKYGRFWSSTSNPKNNNLAYGINFNRKRNNSKSEHGNKEKYKTRYIRCVRLWTYDTVNTELNDILNSPDIKIQNLEAFLQKYTDSQYNEYKKPASKKLEELRKKKKEEFNSLTPIEQKILTINEGNSNMTESISLMNAIENGEFDSEKLDALLKLKELMIKENKWKEASGAKNLKKNKDYQRTLKIIELMDGCK
ncbi:DUF1566 domain-containing protein [Thiothrix litoralis]|uniref:DUF1566 domain-containing protein n=1 Tax=Thiothrix litoralis TaxID=2891210 RepID=A0ABX7WVA1_9GAMM|nr:DUF1566 domain-containing protein [Thiothrix litoralis]QTR46308.1 DUF1566 domain-containing protein [Thiothrix litoralis]